MSPLTTEESHQCDVLPAPRLASSSRAVPAHSPSSLASYDTDATPDTENTVTMSAENPPDDTLQEASSALSSRFAPATRKLCVRHQRMADEGTNVKLQQSLDALPVEERETVNAIWSSFSSSPHSRRELILRGILTMCCFSQLSLLTEQLSQLIRIDPFTGSTICIDFDTNVLASGSVDSTVRVWNFCTGEAFTLRGHRDWVNAVKLWDATKSTVPQVDPSESPLRIETGKMLFSASDDGTIRLWDLARRTCAQQFNEHVGQVQSLRLLELDDGCDEDANVRALNAVRISENTIADDPAFDESDAYTVIMHDNTVSPDYVQEGHVILSSLSGKRETRPKKPVLVSGSLDNTIKVWDIETGQAVRTLFGHIEGVWAVACDKLRLVSASHDRTVKVWDLEEGKCTATLSGHRGAVTCIALGEDKIVSGSDDGDVRIWNFSG
ncbi:hypothetical protein PISMIDRAFT_25873 [Pisolithus microcarpus 441]|uniref:WD40 repeat-like protein n=1 Tax=Pisolithus microcarpus 441 TaxID=765257 RepID=A0A0C9XEP3_9AGAM|nr:hypothetical protein PISMIDRAFT_25873 [Pisolithus microcarpus 441]